MTQSISSSTATIHNVAKRRRYIIGRVFTYFFLTLGGLLFLFPFFWMISLSLGSMKDIYRIPPRYIPEKISWRNYPEALFRFPFFLYLKNTSTIAFWNIIGTVIGTAIPAYAFARLRWKGRDAVFLMILATMMLPPQVTRIPMYVIWAKLGWLDTYKPLIIPSYFGWAYGTFLARQYYTTIPFELEDAARVDGCGFFAIFFKIIAPLSLPLMVTLALFSFVGDWNDFFNPLIYLHSPEKYTLQLGLLSFRGQYITNIPAMMAASVLIILPVLLVFLFGQQYFIRSVVLSGLKG
jgi:multiple sugar transport system permease protein